MGFSGGGIQRRTSPFVASAGTSSTCIWHTVLKRAWSANSPHDFLVARDLENHRLLALETVAEVVADDGVAIGQTMDAHRDAQMIAGDFVLRNLPDGLQVFVEFDDARLVPKTDDEVPIRQLHDFTWVSVKRNLAQLRTVSIEFHHLLLIHQAHPVMPVARAPRAAKLMTHHLGR
jgi:hypothetical protein